MLFKVGEDVNTMKILLNNKTDARDIINIKWFEYSNLCCSKSGIYGNMD